MCASVVTHQEAGPKRQYTGQSGVDGCVRRLKAVFSFIRDCLYQEGEGRSPEQSWQGEPAAGFMPAVILFIALPEAKNNIDPGVIPLGLLPRRCPVCRDDTIIGHGQRLRQAHDDRHERIWARRGMCRPCHKTFTILPDWLAPSAPFTLDR